MFSDVSNEMKLLSHPKFHYDLTIEQWGSAKAALACSSVIFYRVSACVVGNYK